jgi:wyosine [tRNA(Phe)-imidazoG37] synthetase (radical SAM superfamily)
MPGFLFEDVIFGPVRSRRLGLSLGINLLPLHRKYCSFNCIYCECGWTKLKEDHPPEFPTRVEVATYLEERLRQLSEQQYLPGSLTYAGNGEPTIHPEFAVIVEDTIRLRDLYVPDSQVSVLSNASMTGDPAVFDALLKLDLNIQKLDAGYAQMFNLINNPVMPVNFDMLIENLARFRGRVIIQSMFLRGVYRNKPVDNTTAPEVERWLEHLAFIKPSMVMIYSIARATPAQQLERIGDEELGRIAEQVRALGINAEIY